jgi:hypothetical protein
VLGSVLGSVLFGGSTFDQSGLLGSWNYNAPGAAFTTQQALTNAGGTAAITNMASSLASNYSNIGINRLRDISDEQNCPFVLWVGSKRLIKRKQFDAFMEKSYSI